MLLVEGGASTMSTAITGIVTTVGQVVTMMTTGELAIFFYGGVVVLALGIAKKLKK